MIKDMLDSWNRLKLKVFKGRLIGSTVLLIITLTLVFSYYSLTQISIWGFNVPKRELKGITIDTKENSFVITNPQLVLELTEEVSKMKRLNKVEPGKFPPVQSSNEETPNKYTKLLIRADSTLGGSFWQDGNNGIMLDSAGYYWSVSRELLEMMDKSVTEARILR